MRALRATPTRRLHGGNHKDKTMTTKTNNDPLAAMAAKLRAMEEENAKMKAQLAQKGKLSIKVSEKGAVSVYGLGRFPVTLYGSQWEKLLAAGETIKTFMVEHAGALAVKGEGQAPAATASTAPSGAAATAPKTSAV